MPSPAAKKRPKRRRRPVQDRGQATVEVILEAAAQILARKGEAATTTNAVAARAGVSIGTLYQYFGNRDALVAELVRRHVERMQAVLTGALSELPELPLTDAIDRLVAAIVAAHRVSPRLHQALHLSLAKGPAETIDAFEASLETTVTCVLTARAELGLEAPGLTAVVLVRAIGGLVRTTLRREPERIDDPELAASMRAMILGTLDRSRAPRE